MGTFDNCTLGGAQVLIDDVDIGFTEGDIEFGRSAELKKLIDGIPLQTVGQVLLKEEVACKIPAVEITAENINAGGLNTAITTVSGGAVNVSDASNTALTFAINPQYSTVFETIKLPGGTVTNLVVENVAENVIFDDETDYYLDAVNGVVYVIPGSTITSGQTVRVSLDYVAVASKRIKLGANLPITNRKITLIHTSPVSGNVITVVLWKCLGSGNIPLNMTKEEFWNLNMEFTATPDTANHPTEPLGYVEITPA